MTNTSVIFYEGICRRAFFGCTAKCNTIFKTNIIEILILIMRIPRKINFLQLGRYGHQFTSPLDCQARDEKALDFAYNASLAAVNITNALAHRQWEKANLTISIAVYDDRVEIANLGVFPHQITPENINESHESYPYNRNMARALYRSTFLESWGNGIHRIIEACKEQGVEEPAWRCDGALVYVTFKRPTKLDANGTVNETETVNGTVNGTVNETARLILETIAANPRITYKEIVEITSIPRTTLYRYISQLSNSGYITRHGADKNGYWEISNLKK